MPELSQKERLQLSLLDRLSDDEPEKTSETREKRVISVSRLKELVQRDLAWLLNSVAASANMDLTGYPEVEKSTLNFGIIDLSGYASMIFNPKHIERELIKSIKNYEPRIIPKTLKIKISVAQKEMSGNTLSFEISGDLWAQPLPLQLFLKTEVDIENGSVTLNNWN
ncbi:type VI secretion system baseplate subunit TssE [Paraglaciecola arctica]|uniref:Type VI secretion system protein ImpF n=1 Tax=Paraglaciecola arctica BSs20135 TaxID=493475 RepID=K6YU57_9ALTE|nr:type VI secretion system baseplate subunit TssE [Paraglaciecola arctica]GAC21707.1 type VI secretion system protein ImpF [Paraglaciecola arctica BSs20135]|tara:strand:+ start:4563 stop:5063 length:501 start_codon:yes stop_codon:yes gene_type:complete